jgi:hypothetical protein
MRSALLTFAVLLAAAGSAQAECSEFERRPWAQARNFGLSIEAHAIGPACTTAAIALLVTDADGDVKYSFIREAKSMLWFQENVGDGAAMKLGLRDWLESGFNGSPQSTKALPNWKEGAEQPEREGDGEFGFYPGEYSNRLSYLETRAADHPIFCFVSGIESTTCIVAKSEKNITEIGGFTFPG